MSLTKTARTRQSLLDRMSLREQIFILVSTTIVTLVGLISIAVSEETRHQFETNLGQELSELAFNMVDKFDRGMWSREAELGILLELDAIRSPTDRAETRRILDGMKQAVPLFSWVGLLDPTGRVIAATDRILEGDSLAHRSVYTEAREGRFIGDVHDAVLLASKLPSDSGQPMRFVDISVPIHDASGALTGILASHLSWAWAREIETSLMGDQKGRPGVELFIVNAKGQVILSPSGQGRFSQLDLAALSQNGREKRGWTIERWPDGREYLTGFAHELGHRTYAGLGWAAIARQPVETAFQPVRRLQAIILVTGLFCAFIAAVAWWFLANKIARPITHLSDGADSLTSGSHERLPDVGGSKEVRRLSRSLADLVASLTEEESRADRMEALAHQDRLTGLPNRLALDTLLEHMLPRAKRSGEVIACLALDLDGFKTVNDTHGHHAGDQVLREVATRLKHSLRGSDVILRLGGDEFIALLTSDLERWRQDAELCANRIIALVREPIDIGEGQQVIIGISIGVACWTTGPEDFHQVTELADKALYGAKRSGKNRASFFDVMEDLPSSSAGDG